MLPTILSIAALFAFAPFASSSVGHEGALAELPPPVVTASSSQYFERTFNQLVGPLVPEPAIPVHPVLPAPSVIQAPEVIQNHAVFQAQPQPVLPFHSVLSSRGPPVYPTFPLIPNNSVLPANRPVFFQPAPNTVSGNPTFVNPNQQNSSQAPVDPNIAIAIATAYAAAPVATFLLPPYPFGPPPLGFVPPAPLNAPEESREESTTQAPAKDIQTTIIEPEQTTPQPSASSSNTDNSFAQGLPEQNVNFRYGPPPEIPRPLQPFPLQGEQVQPQKFINLPQQNINFRYGPPPGTPQPLQPFPLQGQQIKAQKFKTSVEIVPVPLSYISPPPLTHAHLHHHYRPHHHAKIVKYYVQAVPVRAKIIIRPVTSSIPVRFLSKSVKPVILKKYRVPVSWERSDVGDPQMARLGPPKEREPTTMGPLDSPSTKPPRI